MKKITKLLTFILFCFAFTAKAQQIQTDRPNETESPTAIKVHHLQIESGFSYEKQDDEKTFEIPQAVFRYGLFKNAEIRIETAFKINEEQQEKHDGIDPIVIGAKYHLIDHKGLMPDLALLSRVSIPWMADNAFQDPKYSPEIRMLAQHELSKSSHVGYNMGIKWLAETAHPEYIYTLSADHALTKKIKLVAEAYGFTESHHHAQNSADIALLYVLKKNMQLDIMCGSGIMHSPKEKYVEIGLSYVL
ncbi:transporter [Flavobacterium sp. KJJ]|uniref:transporter n=1 Tax=Flavobacterium sp. KJJ TaxID=1270193 RepID=UPI0004930386|nr:transporter [Flavobacterium sp. KJJ]